MANNQQEKADTTAKPTYQFGLRTLLVLPLFVVTYFALSYTLGGFLAVLLMIPVLLLAACFYPQTRDRAIQWLAVYLIVGVLIVLLLPTISGHPEPIRRSQCTNNLKQIGLALHNYHNAYGSFPPAYIADDEGRPIHSWRVLILPFLEQQRLYDRYRFDEPWDGPNNIRLVKEMPSVFQCPSNQSKEKTCMNYLAVIGPHTAWPGDSPVRFSDIVDGTSNTWLVVEVADSGIAWSEPRDLHVLQMAPQINPPAGQGMSSKHPRGASVLYADGSIRFIGDATSDQWTVDSTDVHNALTIDGGEPPKQLW